MIVLTLPEKHMTTKADTKFNREPERGSHDFDLACEFLDAGKVLPRGIHTG